MPCLSLQGLDWSALRCYSSSGEASSPEDYHWLMALAGYKPGTHLDHPESKFSPVFGLVMSIESSCANVLSKLLQSSSTVAALRLGGAS